MIRRHKQALGRILVQMASSFYFNESISKRFEFEKEFPKTFPWLWIFQKLGRNKKRIAS